MAPFSGSAYIYVCVCVCEMSVTNLLRACGRETIVAFYFEEKEEERTLETPAAEVC